MNQVFCKKEDCCGCGACEQICPTSSIELTTDENGYLFPMIDVSKCVDCGACVRVCPIQNEGIMSIPSKCYAYIDPNEEQRMKSASGGAFSAICQSFLAGCKDYVIYGSTMDETLRVKHCRITNLDQIESLKKSKYLQSKINNEFREIRIDLSQGKKVVFSGTPCQVMALNRFLGKDESGLLTVDFVCHGVPNQLIFDRYVEYIEKKYRNKIRAYKFRNKRKVTEKWTNLGIMVEFENGKTVELDAMDDFYMTGFLSGLFNRESCYKCKFAQISRCSDITIGDYWGIGEIMPSMSEAVTNGTSLILVNSDKGRCVSEGIVSSLPSETYETSIADAARENGQLNKPQTENPRRNVFLSAFRQGKTFDKCMKIAFPEQYRFKKENIYRMNFYIRLSRIKNAVFGRD